VPRQPGAGQCAKPESRQRPAWRAPGHAGR
jgi:hypothetical protein